MMNTISKPKISDDFTVDDIHKIREWHEAMTSGMTDEEFCAFYNNGVTERLVELETSVDFRTAGEMHVR